MVTCNACGAAIPAGTAVCTQCAARAGAPRAPAPASAERPEGLHAPNVEPADRAWERTVGTPMHGHRPADIGTGRAVGGLLLNLFVLPGLGSLLLRSRHAWPQMGLALSAWLLVIVGVLMPQAWAALQAVALIALVIAWVWGLLTGFYAVRDATRHGPWREDEHRGRPSG